MHPDKCVGTQVSPRMTLRDNFGLHTGAIWECAKCGGREFIVEYTFWKIGCSYSRLCVEDAFEEASVVVENNCGKL